MVATLTDASIVIVSAPIIVAMRAARASMRVSSRVHLSARRASKPAANATMEGWVGIGIGI